MNSLILRYILAAAIASLSHVGLAASSDPMGDRLRRMSDVVCGPRCAKYVLEEAGIEADLVRLIEETQWPLREDGASLDALDRALSQRGLHAVPLQVDSSARIDWPHPVIMHMKPNNPDELGHFVVLLPKDADDPMVRIWDGLAGTRSVATSELYGNCSGRVLLTAPEPITEPLLAIRAPAHYRTALWVIVGGVIAGILFVRVRSFRWRPESNSVDGRRVDRAEPLNGRS